MKALVVNTRGGSFELEDVDIAAPTDREVLIEVQASGLCHDDLLFAANDIALFSLFGTGLAGAIAMRRRKKKTA